MIVIGSSLRISLTVRKDGSACDLTGATVALGYIDPAGAIGSWAAVVDSPETDGKVHYDMAAGLNSKVGTWVVWAEVSLPGGNVLVTGATSFSAAAKGTVG